MNKKIVGIVIAVLMSIILIESYVLFNQPKQTFDSATGASDSSSPTITPLSPNESSTELPNTATSQTSSEEVSFVPAVPEFTLKFVKHTFDVPTTSSVDPFTGENKIITGNHWEWTTLDVVITNQKFNGIANSSYLSYSGVMFRVRFRGHYSQEWTNLSASYFDESPAYILQNSKASYTVFSLMISPFDLSYIDTFRWNATLPSKDYPDAGIKVPSSGEADFQVEALFGTASKNKTIPFSGWTFKGVESGWSATRTITIP
jgi:hypothetical protein